MTLIPVIMSGGVGSRLWPASRVAHPKPFITLPDGENLMQKTFCRAAKLPGVAEVLTVTNRDLLFKTEDVYAQSVASSSLQSFILEPFGKNTAAAVAVAALHLENVYGPDTLMLVLAADHLIENAEVFSESVQQACQLAENGWMVTFGVQPTAPETGYGYIEGDKEAELGGGLKVKRFVEKPDLHTAQEYLDSGNYYWNSGMFCFSAGTVLSEYKEHAPELLEAVNVTLAASDILTDGNNRCLKLDPKAFANVPDISIDFSLMEKSKKVAVVPCDIGWSDVGSWDAMCELTPPDQNGNRLEGEVLVHESKNNFVRCKDRLTALVGVENLIVIDTPDAILVADKSQAQDVKHIVSKLKKDQHEAHLIHRTVHRPWGTYTTLEEGDRFKMKRLVVKPGACLSLQMHHHRSEHWIVVSGMAKIVNDNKELMLSTNESTYIPAGHKHRLENPGVIELVMIEVQSGDYLGEDDIVRFEDVYGRVD